MWDSLQNILPGVAAKFHIKKTLAAIDVCREYRRLAPEMLPGESLQNTFPKSYSEKVLTIGVLNSAWAQQLHMHSHRIQKALNDKFGENTVKKIRIQTETTLPSVDSTG